MNSGIGEKLITDWRDLYTRAMGNPEWAERHQRIDAQRTAVLGEMLELLHSYLTGRTDSEGLREIYDRKTRKAWDVFGFKGLSGAMFLNKLVKHVPNHEQLAAELRTALKSPDNIQEARERLGSFYRFLLRLTSESGVPKAALHPGRAPFFVSGWWHLQSPESWPIYYDSGREALETAGLYARAPDPIQDYFQFREAFLALKSALALSPWAFEHLCYLKAHPDDLREPGPQPARPEEPRTEIIDEDTTEISHTQVQWVLATVGKNVGCTVWIAKNDHSKEWKGQRLGELSLESLPPLGLDQESAAAIGRIDVLWLRGKQVAAAFEIEHTTSVYSGLLRMADLCALAPNLNFPLYIVAPEERMEKVRQELSRPAFQALDLPPRCGFFSDEKLIAEADSLMLWATEPSVIGRLASYVEGPG